MPTCDLKTSTYVKLDCEHESEYESNVKFNVVNRFHLWWTKEKINFVELLQYYKQLKGVLIYNEKYNTNLLF